METSCVPFPTTGDLSCFLCKCRICSNVTSVRVNWGQTHVSRRNAKEGWYPFWTVLGSCS